MWTLRQANPNDLPALVQLAHAAGVGLTTFPADPQRLEKRIADSDAGHAPLFVLSHADQPQNIVGVSGLVRSVGSTHPRQDTGQPPTQPFYAYRLERTIHHSDALNVHHEVQALHLLADYDGPTEIGTLFLHPDARKLGLGRLLSLSRFLFMANTPDTFKHAVIAELRGVVDKQGRSPFWDALGSHFFKVDYATADAMSARDKRFIAELMPRHPIYVPLLPQSAQDVIGQVHPHTQAAQALLEHEGFHATPLVDIFDAGPALRCDLQAIRTVRASVVLPAKPDETLAMPDNKTRPTHLICTPDHAQQPFRATACTSRVTPEHAQVPPEALEALHITPGQTIRIAPIR